jgi:hypothetical protein
MLSADAYRVVAEMNFRRLVSRTGFGVGFRRAGGGRRSAAIDRPSRRLTGAPSPVRVPSSSVSPITTCRMRTFLPSDSVVGASRGERRPQHANPPAK